MASNDGVDQLPQLPATPPSPAEIYDEKKVLEKRLSSDSSLDHKVHKVEHGVYDDDDEVHDEDETDPQRRLETKLKVVSSFVSVCQRSLLIVFRGVSLH